MTIEARTAPKTVPGKKPAITAWVGNGGHAAVIGTEVELFSVIGGLDAEGLVSEGDSVVGFIWSLVGEASVAVVDVPDLIEEVPVRVVVGVPLRDVVEEVASFISHSWFPLQLYPNGQHKSPHLGSWSLSLVVLTGFFG
jgi:hypothetical protein